MNLAALNYSIHGLGRLNAVRPQVTSMRFGGPTIPPLQQPAPPQPTLEDRIVVTLYEKTSATAQEIADALFSDNSKTHLAEIQKALESLREQRVVSIVGKGQNLETRQYQLLPSWGHAYYFRLQQTQRRQAA